MLDVRTEERGLLATHAAFLRNLRDAEAASVLDRPELAMDNVTVGGKLVEMIYAPFDYINHEARVVIVGLTPGRQQAVNALRAAREALRSGEDITVASERAKVFASFSGPLRANLVRMLDYIGLSAWLGLRGAIQLWSDKAHLAHFTSLLRYPVFVEGKNWSGQPDAVRTPAMRRWVDDYTGEELSQFADAVIVPLGPKVSAGLDYLVKAGRLDGSRVLSGMPHPSGANSERIACFLGEKPAHLVSAKTNAEALLAARETIVAKVKALST